MARKRVKAGPRAGPRRSAGPQDVVLGKNIGKTRSYAARAALEDVVKDQQTPAAAKVFAARTLAEMDGQIGKHQAPPSTRATAPLASLSRVDLEAELGRLRALIDLGLVP